MKDDPTPIPLILGERPPLADAVKVKTIDSGLGRHHGARTKARKAALDSLYDAEITGRDPLDLVDPGARALTKELVEGVLTKQLEIDDAIGNALTGDWTLPRMPSIDRTLARLATWELLYTDTKPSVAIAEAVALADEYSTDASAAFLSSVLGSVLDNHQSDLTELASD